MDQGVIWSSKAHYRAVSVPKLIDVIEKPILKFSILYAMKILDVVCGRQKLKLLAIVSLKLEFQGTSRCFPRCWQSLQGSPGQLDKLARHTSEFFLDWTIFDFPWFSIYGWFCQHYRADDEWWRNDIRHVGWGKFWVWRRRRWWCRHFDLTKLGYAYQALKLLQS